MEANDTPFRLSTSLMLHDCQCCGSRGYNFHMYVLTVVFGMASWITINGIFSVLPLMIHQVPEGWQIASALSLAIQVGNIGPLIYRLMRQDLKWIPFVVYIILAISIGSMLLLALFWSATLTIGGYKCSFALILFSFTAALSDCTSSLVFWPAVSGLGPITIAGLALGESMSSVSAGAISWIGLPVSGYFTAIAVVVLISGVAFCSLQNEERHLIRDGIHHDLYDTELSNQKCNQELDADLNQRLNLPIPYLIVGLTSIIENAVLPSILPYAADRFSDTAYHAAVTIPAGALALIFMVFYQAPIPLVSIAAITTMVMTGLIVWIGLGNADVTLVFVIVVVQIDKALLAYAKGVSMLHLKTSASTCKEAQTNLETAGGIMQMSSFLGAVIMYLLINCTTVFPAL